MGFLRFAHRYLVRQTMPGLAAGYYDHMVDSVRSFYLWPFCEKVFAAFKRPTRIVDAGTATGNLPVMLARGNPDYHITGIDLSEGCLRVARQRAERAGVADRVTFVRANLERCALETGIADLVVSTCSLHHWRRPGVVLRELARLTARSGQIWILDHSPTATSADRRQWVARVTRAAGTGLLFRVIYTFESRFLAYTESEIRTLCGAAGLDLTSFEIRGMFLLAKINLGSGGHLRPRQGGG